MIAAGAGVRFKFAPNFYRTGDCRVRPGVTGVIAESVTGVWKAREPELGQKVWFIVYHYIALLSLYILIILCFYNF